MPGSKGSKHSKKQKQFNAKGNKAATLMRCDDGLTLLQTQSTKLAQTQTRLGNMSANSTAGKSSKNKNNSKQKQNCKLNNKIRREKVTYAEMKPSKQITDIDSLSTTCHLPTQVKQSNRKRCNKRTTEQTQQQCGNKGTGQQDNKTTREQVT